MDWAKLGNLLLVAGGVVLALLKLLWIPLSWILAFLVRAVLIITIPFQWLARIGYYCMGVPLRFLARFETLFYYFGTACLIGLFSGTALFLTTRVLYQLLHIQNQPAPEPKAVRGRTLASYRAERAQRQANQALDQLRLSNLPTPSDLELKAESRGWSPGGGLARYPLSPAAEKKGLLATTIFEEEDSSDYTTI